jgi:hypothetical protein
MSSFFVVAAGVMVSRFFVMACGPRTVLRRFSMMVYGLLGHRLGRVWLRRHSEGGPGFIEFSHTFYEGLFLLFRDGIGSLCLPVAVGHDLIRIRNVIAFGLLVPFLLAN